jgi:hypothetical protein
MVPMRRAQSGGAGGKGVRGGEVAKQNGDKLTKWMRRWVWGAVRHRVCCCSFTSPPEVTGTDNSGCDSGGGECIVTCREQAAGAAQEPARESARCNDTVIGKLLQQEDGLVVMAAATKAPE